MELTSKELNECLETAIAASQKASDAILDIYSSGNFETEKKSDESPLTKADKESHNIINKYLGVTGFPILSEEGKQLLYNERRNWEYYWLIDPLDGTKEFLNRNGEFTVNIALVKNNTPILGVIFVPAKETLYYALKDGKSWKEFSDGTLLPLPVKNKTVDLAQTGLRIVASRSHRDSFTETFLQKLKEPIIISMGSSLKFMLLAEGEADIYPRFAPTMEWDTAAAQAILWETNHSVVSTQTNL